MSGFLLFGLLITAVAFLLRLYLKQLYRFWENVRVPHATPRFPFGELQSRGWNKNLGVMYDEIYRDFVSERFCGIWLFLTPILMVKDPELIKHIMVKDFGYFHDRGVYYNEKDDPLSAHMFAMEGEKWKNIRMKLSPTFTSSKMKMMFPLMLECSTELQKYLKGPATRGDLFDVVDIMARFTTDVISLCAFGIKTNSLYSPKAEFREMGRKSTEPNLRNMLIFLLQMGCPQLLKFIRARVFYKEVTDYFIKILKEVMDHREKNNVIGNDFLQLLIQLKTHGTIKDNENSNGKEFAVGERLTFEEAAAEAFVFFLAGSETSSSTLQYALYELSRNPQIQETLRTEIKKRLEENDGKLTYEVAHSIPYLDQVIDETLRKYPIVPTLVRECVKNYKIPDSDVIIPKGTFVHIPIFSLHRDEKYFPEPDKFDPERFSDTEKQKMHPYTYMPFGEGPRNCIGKRFGQMQMKVALVMLLDNYKFEVSNEVKDPLTFTAKSFLLVPDNKLRLKITPLKRD